MKNWMTFLLFSIVASNGLAYEEVPAQCTKYEREIRAIEKQMKRGYSASEGRSLKKRKRELSDKLYKCKQKYS